MIRVIFALGVLFLFACSKTEVPATPPVVVAQEEAIKFTTNLDTGTYNVADTLPLVITVSSKLPSAGIIYSILVNWTDSSKQICKLDTSLTVSSFSLNIPGLKKSGNYSLSITVTSKSTTTNTLNKSIPVVNNPLGRFMGYKVNPNAKQLGSNYWKNNIVLSDLVTIAFQTPLGNRNRYGTFLMGLTTGDFNNDGYVDVFNGGASFQGIQSNSTFLMWNTSTKKFDDKNLFNDGTTSFGNPTNVMSLYLNNDNYVDLVIFGHADEGIPNSKNEPISIAISDGKGGYNTIKLNDLIPSELQRFTIEGGDVNDLNNDGFPDLFVNCNSHSYIFWGISSPPYFTNKGYGHFVSDTTNFKSDNGFGEVVQIGPVYGSNIVDVNKDGLNDMILNSSGNNGQEHKILFNQGKGRFNQNGIVKLPKYNNSTEIGIGIQDCVVDDLNGDGLNDIIGLINLSGKSWDIVAYIQKDGLFFIDKSYIIIDNSKSKDPPVRLVYCDFNNDGKKDITYGDGADNRQIIYKRVFIRNDNKFIEQDFYQYDSYMKSLLINLK